MVGDAFFDERTEQSEVKAAIVSKYFRAWATVMLSQQRKHGGDRLFYMELFCGPGRYGDDTASTPLRVLEQAANDADLQKSLVAFFIDNDADYLETLEAEIAKMHAIKAMKHAPRVLHTSVDEDMAEQFESMDFPPTLMFVDPWGYKGLSVRLINSVLKNWGCDCILFFNYNRINMHLSNPLLIEPVNELFGEKLAADFRRRVRGLVPDEREFTIVNEFGLELLKQWGQYVLPFCFKNRDGKRTSHHLFFVSKHQKGYEIMKGIMARASSDAEQGVPSFQYAPAGPAQQLLFDYARPLDDLGPMLLERFAGLSLTMREVFELHNVGTRFVERNYKDVLASLEIEGKIKADPPKERRRVVKGKSTFADTVMVSFPPRKV